MAKKCVFAAFILALSLMCGCASVPLSELYSLPQMADEYLSLQDLIDAEINSGSEYAPPERGDYRQSVQQYDFDGDGREEALAFFRSADGRPKICIYSYDGSSYSAACSIEGEGSSTGRVDHADMDGDGVSELIVEWTMDGSINMLNVYSMIGWSCSVLLTADSYGFDLADLDENGLNELMLLRYDTDGQGFMDMYTLTGDDGMARSTAMLSRGFDSVARFTSGRLAGERTALFVEGTYMGSRTITDVLISDGGELHNAAAGRSGISQTVRSYPVYSEDIDGDGVTEIPSAIRLQPQENGEEHWLFEWYRMDAAGNTQYCATTYHCYADGWFIFLPRDWQNSLTVSRSDGVSGEREVVFSLAGADGQRDVFALCTLTGENRYDRAGDDGRQIITESRSTVYAVRIYDSELSAEDLANSFRFIRSEWLGSAM